MGGSTSSEERIDFLKAQFPDDISPGERVFAKYPCALFRDIHRQGSMYITNKTVYFYSNIVGWKTKVAIPLECIEEILREFSIGVIPNSIQITTKDDKEYFFTSFLSRENAYVMLMERLNSLQR